MDAGAFKGKAAGLLQKLGAYKYVLAVIGLGVLLLLWPAGEKDARESELAGREEDFSVEELETQLEAILGRIDGAGEVSVMLTVRTGMQRVLAEDVTTRADEQARETVVISTGSGKQEVVLLSQRYPTFQGALVVCSGGDDPEVKLLITQAVSALTGLNSGHISVQKASTN